MIIDCISDLHGYLPKLDGGDLLLIAGDLTASESPEQYHKFFDWMGDQKYKKRIFIAGNHDNLMRETQPKKITCHVRKNFDTNEPYEICEYLCDSGTEFEGLKIWGTPWTLTFPNINPKCAAFTGNEERLAEKFKLIPKDTDILITHSPEFGFLDGIPIMYDGTLFHAGSKALSKHIDWDGGLKLHVHGHIHEAYGEYKGDNEIFSYHQVNCSYVNERYKPVNAPIRVIL